MEIRTITDPADGVYNTHTVNLIHCDLGFHFQPGVLCADNGRAAIQYRF